MTDKNDSHVLLVMIAMFILLGFAVLGIAVAFGGHVIWPVEWTCTKWENKQDGECLRWDALPRAQQGEDDAED